MQMKILELLNQINRDDVLPEMFWYDDIKWVLHENGIDYINEEGEFLFHSYLLESLYDSLDDNIYFQAKEDYCIERDYEEALQEIKQLKQQLQSYKDKIESIKINCEINYDKNKPIYNHILQILNEGDK